MQNPAKITLTSELERTHLRFLKVPDNKRLSTILAKLLPGILCIYFEKDLENVAMTQNPKDAHPKIKVLEELVEHLMMKVANSKGEVQIPTTKLLEVFSSPAYTEFGNQHIRNHGKNRIFDFVFASYQYLEKDIVQDRDALLRPVLQSLCKLGDLSQEKTTLIGLLLHRLVYYQKKQQSHLIKVNVKEILESLDGVVKKEGAEAQDPQSNARKTHVLAGQARDDLIDGRKYLYELVSCLYNFVGAFQHPQSMPQGLQPFVTNMTQTMEFIHEAFRDKSNLEDTFGAFITDAQVLVGSIIQDRDTLSPTDAVPFILLMAQSQYGRVQSGADAYLRSFYQDLDRQDQSLVDLVFRTIDNENVYKKTIDANPQQDVVMDQDENQPAPGLPVLTEKYMIEFLLKFDCSAETSQKRNISLIEKCIARPALFLSYAIKFIEHMIKSNEEVYSSNQQSQGFGMTLQIKYLLIKIRNLQGVDENELFQQLSLAQVYVCLADLAFKNYNQIFNSENLSISMLAIEAFQKLKERVAQIEKIKPVREDDLCLILLCALNKFRDIIELNFRSDKSILKQKVMLLDLIVKMMNKQLAGFASHKHSASSSELIYILFLYLASFDKRIIVRQSATDSRAQEELEIPNPSVLLYSITLKEHEDIKIRKECGKQIEGFQLLVEKLKEKDQSRVKELILAPLVEEVKKFFERNEMGAIFLSNKDLKEHMHFTQGTGFQSAHFTPTFIEQCLEISQFTVDFFMQAYEKTPENKQQLTQDDLMILDVMQRQLLMNINLNFTNLKADFIEPLSLIRKLIRTSSLHGFKSDLISDVGAQFIFKIQNKSTNLDQKMLCLKILALLFNECMDAEQQNHFMQEAELADSLAKFQQQKAAKITHEGQISSMVELTICGLHHQSLKQNEQYQAVLQALGQMVESLKVEVDRALTPNIKEQVKILCVALSLFAKREEQQVEYETSLYKKAADLIYHMLAEKEISGATQFKLSTDVSSQAKNRHQYRIHLIKCLQKITLFQGTTDSKLAMSQQLLKVHIGNDYHDVHAQIGKFVAKVCKRVGGTVLQDYCQSFLMNFIKSREATYEWKLKKDGDEEMQDLSQQQEDGDQIMQTDESKDKPNVYAVNLTSRRSCVIYLNELLQLYGAKESFIQESFVDLQKTFLKHIFDKKPAIQDISSRALTLIYKLGTAEVKESLVQALSKTLTGDEKSATHVGAEQNEDKDEDRELMLDFHDQSSTEQRKKLRTYKDLCKVAVEIGHKEMIYQFLEVHRHLSHYQDISNAAKGLNNIIMLDDRLKQDLLKITPKILMLTYDYNEGVRDTMKQLWSTLIDVDKEQQVVDERFQEILAEALTYMKAKEFRKRLSAALILQDLLPNREWKDVKGKYREIFLGALALLDDDIEAVSKAAENLTKTTQRLSLKFANIYSNNNIEELEEVLGILMPMTIDEVIKSNIKKVKFYGVNMLFEIVKSSTQERMYQNLKIQNKYERQLAFSYNEETKMKQILGKYLDKIIIQVLENLSEMNDAVYKINQIEQYAIDKGVYSGGADRAQDMISEGQINDLRTKYTKDSKWGEILAICRKQMDEPIFDKILTDVVNLMFKGHDQVTKSSAVNFVNDIILENKTHLIAPKNARKIAQKLIDLYAQSSIGYSLQLKESLIQLYASCLGLQFKIISAFPNVTNQLIAQVLELPDELEHIKSISIFEILKNLPAEMVRTGGTNGEMIINGAIPMFYINKYKTADQRLRVFSQRVWRYLKDILIEAKEVDKDKDDDLIMDVDANCDVEVKNSEQILTKIGLLFDSNNYDERIAAGLAMEDLCQKMPSEDIGSSPQVKENVDKMYDLMQGKFFNNKETLLDSFMKICELMEQHSPLVKDAEFTKKFLITCLLQIQKFQSQNLEYKNKLLKCIITCISTTSVKEDLQDQVGKTLLEQLSSNLELIASSQSAMKEKTFEERKDDEKQSILTIGLSCEALTLLKQNHEEFLKLCENHYGATNFLVRNSMLKSIVKILKGKKEPKVKYPESVIKVVEYILSHVQKCGEKYDINLELLSDMCLLISQSELPAQKLESISNYSQTLVEILKEKGGEHLIKNIDVIRGNLGM